MSSFGLNLEKILVLGHLWNILYSCLEPAESILSFGGFGVFCLPGVFCVREVVPTWKTRHWLLGMLLVLVKDLLAYLWLSMKVLCAELIIIACHTILCFMWKYKNIDVQIQLNFWLRENPRNFFFSGLECFCHSHGLEFTLCKYFVNIELSCFLKTKQWENPNASYRDTPPTFFELRCLLKCSCCVHVTKIVS